MRDRSATVQKPAYRATNGPAAKGNRCDCRPRQPTTEKGWPKFHGYVRIAGLVRAAGASPVTRRDPVRRRESIIDAALRQAFHGYDAVQIRAVADAAGVSTSAVYHYFSSKDGLLLECLHSWLSEFEDSDALAIVGKRGPNQRLLRVVESLTERLSLTPRLADTMARAYLHATGSASDTAEFVRDTLIEIFTEAMHPERPQYNDHVAALMADVWIANVLAIAQNRMTAEELRRRFEHAISAIDKNARVS